MGNGKNILNSSPSLSNEELDVQELPICVSCNEKLKVAYPYLWTPQMGWATCEECELLYFISATFEEDYKSNAVWN